LEEAGMNKFFNLAFWFGFAVGFLSFAIFNLMVYKLTLSGETRIYNRMNNIGFPFSFYEWGGNPYVERFLQFGLIADIVIVLVHSLLIGLFFRYLWNVQTKYIVK
jgi:hypothetical protein